MTLQKSLVNVYNSLNKGECETFSVNNVLEGLLW